MRNPKRRPTPLILSRAKGMVRFPSMFVLRIRWMCLKVFSASYMIKDIVAKNNQYFNQYYIEPHQHTKISNNNWISVGKYRKLGEINLAQRYIQAKVIKCCFFMIKGQRRSFQLVAQCLVLQQQSKQLMQESGLQDNICQDCGLHFQTPSQLLNHKRRFCVNSGYDNLQGLAKIEFNGVAVTHQPKVGHKNYLQHYGTNSLTKIDQYDSLSATNLEREMKGVHRFKRQLQGVQKYQRPPKESLVSSKNSVGSKSAALGQSRNNYYLQESQLEQDLKRYEKAPKQEAISPPTFIDQLNMRNHTVLDKSNSSLGRMALKDRIEYARVKLDELNDIKDLYVKNGGTKHEFKENVDKMIEFYKRFLKENEEKSREDGPFLNSSQGLIQSRVSTPILKLRQINEEELPQSRRRNKQSAVKEKPLQKSKANPNQNPMNPNMPFMNGFPYGQAPIIMMPYAPPSQPSSVPADSMRFLQKMMQLKSEENQRLMEILLQDKRRGNQMQQPTIITVPQYGTLPSTLPINSSPPQQKSNTKPKGSINVDDDYQFKKSMIQDLISEEKVLLAMQQEQLDEMKLLSQLPKDLQQVKIKSLIKASQTRHRVEKQILKQKIERLAYQEQNQAFEQNRKLGNDRWAGQERKKLLENQMNQYVTNFEEQFNSDPPHADPLQ